MGANLGGKGATELRDIESGEDVELPSDAGAAAVAGVEEVGAVEADEDADVEADEAADGTLSDAPGRTGCGILMADDACSSSDVDCECSTDDELGDDAMVGADNLFHSAATAAAFSGSCMFRSSSLDQEEEEDMAVPDPLAP